MPDPTTGQSEASGRGIGPMERQAIERREALASWLRERSERSGLRTSQIVEQSGLYDRPYGGGKSLSTRLGACLRDLYDLEALGIVQCIDRPARWEVQT